MNRLNLITLVFSVLTLLVTAACTTGGGYSSNRNWEYNTAQRTPIPAEQPPATLDGSYGMTPAPSAQQTAQVHRDDLPPVKVGILLPLSGQHKHLGEAMLRAAQLAVFDVGHQNFELIPHDTLGTSDGARNAARAVLAQGAQLILGPVFSEDVREVRSVAQTANVNVIGFSTDWKLAGGNTFIMGFLPFDQVERLTTYIASRGIQEVGILTPTGEYGNAVETAYKTVAARHNMPPPYVTAIQPQIQNLSTTVRQFTLFDPREAQANAQNIPVSQIAPPFRAALIPFGGETATNIGKLLDDYGAPSTTVRRLGTGLFDDASLATQPSLNGAWFAAPSPRLRQSFESRYRSTYSASAPRLATLAYDATALAAVLAQRGLQAHGRPDFSRETITNPNGFAGIDGIFRFRNDGTAERGLAILEFSQGTIRIVDDAPTTFQRQTN